MGAYMAAITVVALLLGVLLFVLAYSLWQKSYVARQATGVPPGRIVYEDVDQGRPPEGPLISKRWRLVGKPDYLLETDEGLIPVEVKSANLPRSGTPYWGHVLQLAAYCLLVEETFGKRPPHGYIRYRDKTVQVPYTEDLRNALLDTLFEVQMGMMAEGMARSHDDPWRCAHCGLAYVCGRERIVS